MAFSWQQFLWIVAMFVGVPTALASWALWQRSSSDESTGPGRLGPLVTGLVATALGFVACAGWLSWSAHSVGGVRGIGLPTPTKFPTWQVVACGVTVVLFCWLSAHLSSRVVTGGYAAAIGTTAGFATAFGVSASTDTTGQSGVGVVFSVIGWGVGLSAVMWVRANYLARTH